MKKIFALSAILLLGIALVYAVSFRTDESPAISTQSPETTAHTWQLREADAIDEDD
jgi:hypothetical protein